MLRLTRDQVTHAFDAATPNRAEVSPGSTLIIETHDARTGSLLGRELAQPYALPLPTPGRGNPITGPVSVLGAEPGDTLVVDIGAIRLVSPGWCGGHAHVGPTRPGYVPRPIGRTCRVDGGWIEFAPDIRLPVAPMIGCLGTAPAGGPVSTAFAGRHGGNMDQSVVTCGARVHLPVEVTGGLLFAGDVHATQGDGELSGVALEIAAEVELTVNVVRGVRLTWPWLELGDRIMVLTAGASFEEARAEAVEVMIRSLGAARGLEPADALGLLSLAGDLRIGQAYGASDITVRLEIPAALGARPHP